MFYIYKWGTISKPPVPVLSGHCEYVVKWIEIHTHRGEGFGFWAAEPEYPGDKVAAVFALDRSNSWIEILKAHI